MPNNTANIIVLAFYIKSIIVFIRCQHVALYSERHVHVHYAIEAVSLCRQSFDQLFSDDYNRGGVTQGEGCASALAGVLAGAHIIQTHFLWSL